MALAAIIIAAPTTAGAQSTNSLISSAKEKLSSISSSSSSSTSSSSSSSDSSSSSLSSLVSGITSLFSSSKTATAKKIVGTWSYSEPAIVLSSDNVLSSAAAKTAASKIESTLQTQLEKYGITEGALTLTFKSDNTFTSTLNSKTVSGTWEITDGTLNLTFSGSKTVAVETQISGSTLQIVTDADGLLSLIQGVASTAASASSSSSLSTITSLMSKVDGMQVGLSFTKS